MTLFYLPVEQVLEIHAQLIDEHDSSHGVRSNALLESAVFRMQATFDGEDLYSSAFDKAAALFESLCKNHPFIDGNKRTAFVSSITFLEINGYDTTFPFLETESFVLQVATEGLALPIIAAFFKKHSRKLK